MDTFFTSRLERDRSVEEILESNTDALTKVQRLIKIGIDEDEADELVSRQQLGVGAPVYYERLSTYDEE